MVVWSSQCHTVDEAWAAASSSVLFVAPADKLALVVAELERRLPAHFLGLKKAYPDRRRMLRSSTDDRASRAMKHLKHVHHHQTARERHKARTAHWEHAALEDAFVASNPIDLGVYDRAVAALEQGGGARRDAARQPRNLRNSLRASRPGVGPLSSESSSGCRGRPPRAPRIAGVLSRSGSSTPDAAATPHRTSPARRRSPARRILLLIVDSSSGCLRRALALLEGVLPADSQGPRKLVVSTVVRRRRVEPRQQRRLGGARDSSSSGAGGIGAAAQRQTTDRQLRRHEQRRRRRCEGWRCSRRRRRPPPRRSRSRRRRRRPAPGTRRPSPLNRRAPTGATPRRRPSRQALAVSTSDRKSPSPARHGPGPRTVARASRSTVPVRLIAHGLLGDELERAARARPRRRLPTAAHRVAPMEMRAVPRGDAIAVPACPRRLYAPVAVGNPPCAALVELRRHRVARPSRAAHQQARSIESPSADSRRRLNAFGFILFKAASLQPLMLSTERQRLTVVHVGCVYDERCHDCLMSAIRSNGVFPNS